MKNNKSLSQQFLWEKMTMKLRYVRKGKTNMFVPKIIVRKKEKEFVNNVKVG